MALESEGQLEQPGCKSGVTRRLPAIIPVAILYSLQKMLARTVNMAVQIQTDLR